MLPGLNHRRGGPAGSSNRRSPGNSTPNSTGRRVVGTNAQQQPPQSEADQQVQEDSLGASSSHATTSTTTSHPIGVNSLLRLGRKNRKQLSPQQGSHPMSSGDLYANALLDINTAGAVPFPSSPSSRSAASGGGSTSCSLYPQIDSIPQFTDVVWDSALIMRTDDDDQQQQQHSHRAEPPQKPASVPDQAKLPPSTSYTERAVLATSKSGVSSITSSTGAASSSLHHRRDESFTPARSDETSSINAPLFGTRPSKKNSLEEDLPLSLIQQQEHHSNLTTSSSSSAPLGQPQTTGSSLLDDDDSEDEALSPSTHKPTIGPAGGMTGSLSPTAPTATTITRLSSKPQVSFAALPQIREVEVTASSRQREFDTTSEDYVDDSKLPPPPASTIATSTQISSTLSQEWSTSSSTTNANELEAAREYARTLLDLCSESNSSYVDPEYLETMIHVCSQSRETVNNAIQALADGQDDFEELLQLNEHLSHAMAIGEKARAKLHSSSLPDDESSTRPHLPSSEPSSSDRSESTPSAPEKRPSLPNLDVGIMVQNRDVFSLICMLRAQQSDRRLEAAYALMEFARNETSGLRPEIRSSGGLHSLLTLFRAPGTPYETKVVVSLAVSYLLTEVDKISVNLGLKIVECLRLLSRSRKITPHGRTITREECHRASAKGVMMFWINHLLPMLATEGRIQLELNKDATSEVVSLSRSSSGSSRFRNSRISTAGGGLFDQRRELIELQELLDMTVSLIVCTAEPTSDRRTLDESYMLVEEVCAVEVARPIAVREGILRTLVGWIKSKDPDKIRPAASSLRHLTSIKDSYMAGWIHSQIVNEGILDSIVQLMQDLDRGIGPDVQLAVAQILSCLCVAPHTRAAVADANGISLLIQFLVEHTSSEGAYFAGRALVQLASGAITRATVFGDDTMELEPSNKIVDTIIETGAIESFVEIAESKKGKLRTMAVEALRVLSEDTTPSRQTRAELCYHGAARALGVVLKDHVVSKGEIADNYLSGSPDTMQLKELHEALCALANILDPLPDGGAIGYPQRRQSSDGKDTRKLLINGCKQTADSGGLEALLFVSSITFLFPDESNLDPSRLSFMGLLEEACRSLASMSPLLLTDAMIASGLARWTDDILKALYKVTKELKRTEIMAAEVKDSVTEVQVNVLRGLGALARSEPLKIRIIDFFLPFLLTMNSGDTSTAANQAFQSLGFTDDEVAVQVAGNNPQLLADWFCLERSCIIQALARDEIRGLVQILWGAPFKETSNTLSITRLIRDSSDFSRSDDGSSVCGELYQNFASDAETWHKRESMIRQYRDIYGNRADNRPSAVLEKSSGEQSNDDRSEHLLSRQVYPLNSSEAETDWILAHDQMIQQAQPSSTSQLIHRLSSHVETLLNHVFPSQLIRGHVLPINTLQPNSSFNFRGLMMPQKRYFSFRREGQLLSRLCANEAAILDSSEVHWTLGFTNSSFAGEFSESLVQALYMCPMILGLSFSCAAAVGKETTNSKVPDDDGGAILANLVGSLPPWISSLTFDGLLSDRDMKSLVAILETVGKLSVSHDANASEKPFATGPIALTDTSRCGSQGQGRFCFLAIKRSPEILSEAWKSFFRLFGGSNAFSSKLQRPMSSLKILDLSGNQLGDDLCAAVLQMVHDKDSGCLIEQLDLSGNSILAATSVLKVLRGYVEFHRYSHQAGRTTTKKGWKSRLHTLILADNGLHVGNAWVELISLLKHNALELRVMDLSGNGLVLGNHELDLCDAVVAALLKNTSLQRLNLSRNNISNGAVTHFLEHLAAATHESSLAFLEFDDNEPPLSEAQAHVLASVCARSRKHLLQRFLNDREKTRSVSFMDGVDIGVSSQQSSYSDGLVLPEPEPSSFSLVDTPTERTEVKESHTTMDENAITVLFSAPLVFFDDRNIIRPFAKLDFGLERELMWQCLKEASRDIELYFDNATPDRFLAAISKRCSCLHYSGHGHQEFLPFENRGGPHWLGIREIQDLIAREGGASFRFVFVSACYSFNVGQTFASAGVAHVVCCEEGSELKDAAALAFTRNFYLALAVGNTVKESFDQGCKAVRATPNLRNAEQEMKKFRLLPEDGDHDVPIFVNAKPVLEWPKSLNDKVASKSRRSSSRNVRKGVYSGGTSQLELSVRNMIQEDPSPSPPQFFLGREVDMFHVLRQVLEKRLVSVVGEAGIGRSSLVCALCHYINERASTMLEIERIYFVKAKQDGRQKRSTALIRRLIQRLVEADKLQDPPGIDSDIETMTEAACRALKNDKALIVFDRVDLLNEVDEANEFPIALKSLLSETRNLKVLLTNRRPLGIPSIGEKSYELGPLNLGNTVRLFAFLCPYVHTPKERQKLFKSLVPDVEQEHMLPTDPGLGESTAKMFSVLGSGIPAKIEKAAYNVSKEVFLSLMNGSILDNTCVEVEEIKETEDAGS